MTRVQLLSIRIYFLMLVCVPDSQRDECGDMAEFGTTPPVNYSFSNFSFKVTPRFILPNCLQPSVINGYALIHCIHLGCYAYSTIHVGKVWCMVGGIVEVLLKNILYQFIDDQTRFGMPRGACMSVAVNAPKLVSLHSNSNSTSKHAPEAGRSVNFVCKTTLGKS